MSDDPSLNRVPALPHQPTVNDALAATRAPLTATLRNHYRPLTAAALVATGVLFTLTGRNQTGTAASAWTPPPTATATTSTDPARLLTATAACTDTPTRTDVAAACTWTNGDLLTATVYTTTADRDWTANNIGWTDTHRTRLDHPTVIRHR